MARALIIGAGGIGRGFVPWILPDFEIDLLDANAEIVAGIEDQGFFTSWMSDGTELRELVVRPLHVTTDIADLELADYDIAFISVGPRNVSSLPRAVGQLQCPVFSLENDPATVEWIRELYDVQNVMFGVPDVIASSTASPRNLRTDPLSLHTENGIMYLQDAPCVSDALKSLLPDVVWLPVERLNAEWDAKLYIHNTPHCIAAFLGYQAGVEYLHQALARPAIAHIIDGVVDEILGALKVATKHDHDFLESYAKKEVRRFTNPHLFDPILRVAREPIRKLHPSGRLMGALRLCLTSGIEPVYLTAGIAAGLSYANPGDKDHAVMALLSDFGVPAFMQFHLSLPPDALESEYVAASFPKAMSYLNRVLL